MPDNHVAVLVLRHPDYPTEIFVGGTTDYDVVSLDAGAGFDVGNPDIRPGTLEAVAYWAIKSIEDLTVLLKAGHYELALHALNFVSDTVHQYADLIARNAMPDKRDDRPFCQAKTRRQMETPYWGESKIGCSRYGVVEIDGHWACKQHADPDKRYGWNS